MRQGSLWRQMKQLSGTFRHPRACEFDRELVKQILQNFLTHTLRNKGRKQFLGQKKGGLGKL